MIEATRFATRFAWLKFQIYEIQVEVKIEIEGGNNKILNLSLDLNLMTLNGYQR